MTASSGYDEVVWRVPDTTKLAKIRPDSRHENIAVSGQPPSPTRCVIKTIRPTVADNACTFDGRYVEVFQLEIWVCSTAKLRTVHTRALVKPPLRPSVGELDHMWQFVILGVASFHTLGELFKLA